MTPAPAGTTPKQIEIYRADGVVRLPGAVPIEDVARLAGVVWRRLRERHGIVRDRPETWATTHPAQLTARSNELAAMGSPRVRAVLDQVLGAEGWIQPERWAYRSSPRRVRRPSGMSRIRAGTWTSR